MELAGTCSEVCCYFGVFFQLSDNIWITFQSWNTHSSANVKTIRQFPLRVMHLLLKEKECLLPLFSPPSGVPCWENPCLRGQKLFPFKLLFFQVCFFSFYCKLPRKVTGLQKPSMCACVSGRSLLSHTFSTSSASNWNEQYFMFIVPFSHGWLRWEFWLRYVTRCV